MNTIPALCLSLLAACAFGAEPVEVETLTIDKREYHSCRVTLDDPATVKVMHRDGIARIDAAELPAEVLERLDYDPAAADEIRAAEAAKEAAAAEARRKERHIRQAMDMLKEGSVVLKIDVISITDDGLLGDAQAPKNGRFRSIGTIFVETRTDGVNYLNDRVYAFRARRSNTITYTTVLGAERTVPLYRDLDLIEANFRAQ